MAEVTLTINGRNYGIACDDGQERRLTDLGRFIDSKVREIAQAGAANNEAHLMILTSLMLADEIFDLRSEILAVSAQMQAQAAQTDDQAIADSIVKLAEKIDAISGRLQKV